MSDATTHDDQELLLAVGPARSRAILGVRGMMMRDLAGELARLDLPACTVTAFVAGIPSMAGLHVWCGTITGVEGWRKYGWPADAWKNGAWRPAVAGDLARFGLPPLLPRNPPEGAAPC